MTGSQLSRVLKAYNKDVALPPRELDELTSTEHEDPKSYILSILQTLAHTAAPTVVPGAVLEHTGETLILPNHFLPPKCCLTRMASCGLVSRIFFNLAGSFNTPRRAC